jgi:excisionase family DNA binding protein
MPAETIKETPRRLFAIQAAVEYLRELGAESVSVNFVRNLINRAEVPHIRMGKRFYITRQALDNWIERHERKK